MATPVLPYPDMDFTPLDILTAAEMDQMVANDQYLRDFCAGLADGTNLSDGVIQARKLASGLSSYSTAEQDTGVTWIDGRHIYKKTLNFGALPNNSQKTISTGVSGIEKVLRFEGYAYAGSSELLLPYLAGGSSNEANVGMGYLSSTSQIRITTGQDRSNYTECYVTIYYIKAS